MVVLSAFEACRIGDIETLRRLPNVLPTLVDDDGASCLHFAARGGSLSVVEYLVKSLNFSATARTKNGATALHDAAAKGNTAVVKWLVENGGVDVDDKDSAGITALHLAARYCHFLTVEWLLDEACAEASVRSNTDALPLHFAVTGGDLNCVKTLVDENPRLINMQMNNGVAPVYLASQAGYLEILQYLISKNGATKVKAYDAMSCLHAAAQKGHLDVVKWLVTVDKSNPNDRDFDGATPLHFAAGRGHADVVRWLLKEGGARVTLDNLGGSPLHTAAELGELQCVQALLDCGCDTSLTDNAGLTAAELADDCDQTQAAALIRGEVTLASLGAGVSPPSEHRANVSSPPPPPSQPTGNNPTSTKVTYPQTLSSPPLPPPPAHQHSVAPSASGSPLTPPTPIHEDENDPVSALGHGVVSQSSEGAHSISDRPPFKRTVSRISVDSSASNFGVFEQPDAGVLHTVIAEVHKAPKIVPPTPRLVTSFAVPGHGSLNSTQESIVFSTSSSSFSQDESSPIQERKLIGKKNTRLPSSLSNTVVSEFPHQRSPSPPLAHSTLSSKRNSHKNGPSKPAIEAQDSSQYSTSNSSPLTEQDTEKDINKFSYYSTPYKKDFNTLTKSSFAQAKALFQQSQASGLQICPDSGEVCSKSDKQYNSVRRVSTNSRMSAHEDQPPTEIKDSSNSRQTCKSQGNIKSVINIQGHHTTIIATESKPTSKEESQTTRMSTPDQAEASHGRANTESTGSSVQAQTDNMLRELMGKGLSQVASSPSSATPTLVNGHANTSASSSNHLGARATGAASTPAQLAVNGSKAKEDDRSTNSRRSSSGSSTSSQTFNPAASKYDLIADIQSAVSGTSNLSLRRAKGRGEGVSMVYQSKNRGSTQGEAMADQLPLAGKFDPKNFLESVEKVDSSGRAIPEWRRQVLAKHLAEKAQKEFEDQKSVEDYEARFKDMPVWKRALIERKEAQAREEAASNKK